MSNVVPDSIRQFACELEPRISRWHGSDYRTRIGIEWDVLRAKADEMWTVYRKYIHEEFAKHPKKLDGRGRRRLPEGEIPARTDHEGLHVYQRAVLLPDESALMSYASILLRACTIDCLPYAARLYGLDRQEWGDALYYVVEFRLILFDAVQYAFGPHRVQTIGARKLFYDRLKNFAENLRSGVDRYSIDAADQDGDAAQFDLPAPGPSLIEGVVNKDLADRRKDAVRQMIEFVRLHPPAGIAPDIAALALEGTMQVGKSDQPLAAWLSGKTGRQYEPEEVRGIYRAVSRVCQLYAQRENLRIKDLR